MLISDQKGQTSKQKQKKEMSIKNETKVRIQ